MQQSLQFEDFKRTIGSKMEKMLAMATAKNEIIEEQKKKISWLKEQNA